MLESETSGSEQMHSRSRLGDRLRGLAARVGDKIGLSDDLPSDKFNVPGPFAVKMDQCEGIAHCFLAAPGMFGAEQVLDINNNRSPRSYVRRQPTTQEEYEKGMNAVLMCPFEAITVNGSAHGPEVGDYVQLLAQRDAQLEALGDEDASTIDARDCDN